MIKKERDMIEVAFANSLSKKVPFPALEYCVLLWSEYPFSFKLRRKRLSKLGDYRFDPRTKTHTVTINQDLNRYQFLMTYVHEVAHRVVHRSKSGQKPHGVEWKTKFKALMLPLLRPEVFPSDLLSVLAKHMKNPKASVAADPQLARAFAKYDESNGAFTLSEVPLKGEFNFRNRRFQKLEKKRTRSVCQDLGNGKRYLIPELAEVKLVD